MLTDEELRPKQEPRSLFDVWEETEPVLVGKSGLRWKAQLIKYVASFPTKDAADRYIKAVIREREKNTK